MGFRKIAIENVFEWSVGTVSFKIVSNRCNLAVLYQTLLLEKQVFAH